MACRVCRPYVRSRGGVKMSNQKYYIEVETCEGIETQDYRDLFHWIEMLNEYALNDMGVYAYGIYGGDRVEL